MHPTKEQFLVALLKIETFSPAPVILASALRLLSDPKSDIDSIAALVGRDSALTAEIIRCANSAYYGGLSCSNIAEATQKIGLRETMRLMNLAVARIVSGRDLGCYGIHGGDFWAESLFNGIFMQVLARETGGADPDEAYTVGLLRFIGRLGINQAIESTGAGLYWDGRESIAQWELENVGLVQAQAGAALLGKWLFSDTMVQAVAGQDAPAALTEKSWLAEALYFSSALLPQGLGTPFRSSTEPMSAIAPVGSEFMHSHDLDAAGVESLLKTASEEFDRIRANFGG